MMKVRLPRCWLPLYLQLFLGTTVLTASCFFPNGGEANKDVPCSSDDITFCCRYNDICLSNGVCMNVGHQPYTISRGSCTGRDWKSDKCPSVCRGPRDNPGGGASILDIGSSERSAKYCCNGVIRNGSSVRCANGDDPFPLQDGEILLGYAALSNVVSTMSATASRTPPARTGPPPFPGNRNNRPPSSGPNSVAIGVGVGVPLGVIALAAIGWVIYERRKHRRYITQEQTRYSDGSLSARETKNYNPRFVQRPAAELSAGEVGRPELDDSSK
ncbi:hypothetical protein PRK78_001859 [Emydomyces testavorans]|uniref:Mid2 domain-containing protein n=1 Tax=Emydomyces testavorans TaxID=2070801 RepID=A0AAF0DD75_9EURO|nr:hypothetical protein PRK78_001859 [Emydomyces testavorans]